MISPALLSTIRSPLFLIPATALLVLLLVSSVFQRQQQQLLDERTSHYGEALASLAARQAIDSTLNHDLISLQVTLSDVAENPHVLIATIHDVENRLLVQAGESPNTGDYRTEDGIKFSAPITLHDSVAGYVTVTIDSKAIYEHQSDSWLLGLMVVMATLAGLSLFNQHRATPADTHNLNEQDTRQHRNKTLAQQKAFTITLELQCLNIDTLRKQLSGSMRQQLFEDLERRLSAINTLYNGRVFSANTSGITLTFADNDIANGCFRAICTSQLLFRLLKASEQPVKLNYSAAIYRLHSSTRLAEQMQQAKFIEQCRSELMESTNSCLKLHADSCGNSQLLQRLDTDSATPWQMVSGLQPSYNALIDKHEPQLLQLLNH